MNVLTPPKFGRFLSYEEILNNSIYHIGAGSSAFLLFSNFSHAVHSNSKDVHKYDQRVNKTGNMSGYFYQPKVQLRLPISEYYSLLEFFKQLAKQYDWDTAYIDTRFWSDTHVRTSDLWLSRKN